MSGVKQTFWASMESLCRFLARAPFGVGNALMDLADRCRERAR